MAKANHSLDPADTTINPVQALADTWAELGEIDEADLRLHAAEEEAHRRKEALEEAILARPPTSIDDCLAIVCVVYCHMPAGHEVLEDALERVGRWLAQNGAASPILDVYLMGGPRRKAGELSPAG